MLDDTEKIPKMKTNLHWVESHCHLDFSDFNSDRAAIISQCVELGMQRLLVPGVVSSQWPLVSMLAETFEPIYFAVGVHPWWIPTATSGLKEKDFPAEILDIKSIGDVLEQFLQHPKCVAVGECGLDAAIDVPMSLQCDWLAAQLNIAQQKNLPVILHAHCAHNELIALLKNFSLKRGGVVHAFSGSKQMAEEFIQLGFKLGVGGIITYERAQKTRDAIRSVSLEFLLLETDAPDMPLFGFQGQRNSPEKILLVVEALAKLRGESIEVVVEQTTKNARELFRF